MSSDGEPWPNGRASFCMGNLQTFQGLGYMTSQCVVRYPACRTWRPSQRTTGWSVDGVQRKESVD
eukprot:9299250-Pyramimonas_sp.AAC.1